MKNINRNVTKFAALAVVVLSMLVSTVSFAQQSEASYKASIPFAFQVGDTLMPAGDYIVKTTEHFIQVRPADAAKGVGMVTYKQSRKGASQANVLVFNVYGDQHFLSQLWFEGSDLGRSVTMSKSEAQIAKQGRESQVQLALKGN